METIESNRLIAEFMGGSMVVEDRGINIISLGGGEWCDLHELKYHGSWDWLMPVVERIGKLPFSKTDGLREYMSTHFNDVNVNIFSTIEEVYQAVVRFIQWYNQQEK